MLAHAQGKRSDVRFAGRLATGSRRQRNRKWVCGLSETLVGEYLVIPLVSTRMLKSEGYWMNTCCREYADRCAEGTYSLFSLRSRSGERLATLGLAKDLGRWVLAQCCGPSNSDVLEETLVYLDEDDAVQTEWVPTELYYVAQEVVRLMNGSGGGH